MLKKVKEMVCKITGKNTTKMVPLEDVHVPQMIHCYNSYNGYIMDEETGEILDKESAALLLCRDENIHCMHIEEHASYCNVKDFYGFTLDDFIDDQSIYDDYEKEYIGLYNWVYKPHFDKFKEERGCDKYIQEAGCCYMHKKYNRETLCELA
jgi:hypothetical protein